MRLGDVTGIDGRTGSTDGSTEGIGEFADELEGLLRTDAATTGDDLLRTAQLGREEVSTTASNESIAAERLPESATSRACVFADCASARASIAPRRTVTMGAPKVGAEEAV